MYKYRKLSQITSISLICVLLASVFMLAPVSVSAAIPSGLNIIEAVAEDTEIHLFNYGSGVMNLNNLSVLLRDSSGNINLTDGYPYNLSGFSYIGFYNKDFEHGVAQSNVSVGTASYTVTHYEVENDGTGTGLFLKDADTGALYFNSKTNYARYDYDTKKFVLYDGIYTTGLNQYFHPLNQDTYEGNGMGMSIEWTYIQKNTYDNGAEIVYSANNDDDVALYIDGVLILYTPFSVNYSVNFTTGEIKGSSTTTIKAQFEKALAQAEAENNSEAAERLTYILENDFDGNTFKEGTTHNSALYWNDIGQLGRYFSVYLGVDSTEATVDVDVSKTVEYADEGDSYVFYFYSKLLTYNSTTESREWTDTEYYTSVSTDGDETATSKLKIYCDVSTDCTLYYWIYEAAGDSGGIVYDGTSYIVEVTVENGSATVTKVTHYTDKKTGTDVENMVCAFENTKLMEITVSKTVEGIDTDIAFEFTLTLTDSDDEPYITDNYVHSGSDTCTVDEITGKYTFSLENGESITFYVPYGTYSYTVSEAGNYTGYDTTAKVNGSDVTLNNLSYSHSITSDETVLYTNTLKTLPGAGGAGLYIFIFIGLMLCISSIAFMLVKSKLNRMSKKEK